MGDIGRYLRTRAMVNAGIDLELLNERRQLSWAAERLLLDDQAISALREYKYGVAHRASSLAEERFKRKSLERKI